MAQDIGSSLAKDIDEAKTFSSSANMRCGKNRFMVINMRGDEIDNGKAKNNWAFIELLPLTSETNPQMEGDWMLDGKQVPPGTAGAKLIDDGMNPNRVGELCAVKANFTSNKAVAAGKIKQFLLAAFNKRESECKPGEIGSTWDECCRQKAGYYVRGSVLNEQVVPPGTPGSTEAWVSLIYVGGGYVPVTKETPGAVWKDANPLAGFVIDCVTRNKKKKTANEFGAFVGVQNWSCVAPPRTGENTIEAMKKRLAEHAQTIEEAVEDDGSSLLGQAPAVTPPAGQTQQAATQAVQQATTQLTAPATAPATAPLTAPTPPATAPTPPPAVDPNWPPQAPWEATAAGGGVGGWQRPGFVWSNPGKGGSNAVLTEVDYRAGKR